MTRDGYRTFMLVFVTLLPLFVLAMAGWLPRLVPGAVNVPNRQLWMAPERRQASLDFLLAHAAWLGCVMVLFVVAIHKLLLDANAASSPRLPQPQFFVLMVGFVLALLIWIALLLVRFRKRP